MKNYKIFFSIIIIIVMIFIASLINGFIDIGKKSDAFYFVMYLFLFLSILALFYIAVPNKRFIEVLEDREPKSGDVMMIWGLIPVGTLFLGSRRLDRKQYEYYGFNEFCSYDSVPQNLLPRIRTLFIAFIIPLLPLRSQIIFNEEKKGIIFRETGFNAIPIKMCWNQVFSVLIWSYAIIAIIIILLDVFAF